MKNIYYIISILVTLSFNSLFAINTTADWVLLFNNYKTMNSFAIASGGIRVNTDFYSAMYVYSNRTAVLMANENTFEELSAGLNILVSMYQATGDVSYLENVLVFAENIINKAHLLSSGETEAGYNSMASYNGWNQNPNGSSDPTEEIKPFRYILKMCRIIAANPTLYATYQTRVNALVAFIEYNVWQKWWNYKNTDACGGPTMKRANTHITCNWAFVATELLYLKNTLNIGLAGQSAFMTSAALASYQNQIDWFNNNMVNYSDLNSNGQFRYIMYHYNPSQSNTCGGIHRGDPESNNSISSCSPHYDDVSHANFVVSYILENYELYPNVNYTLNGHIVNIMNNYKNTMWKGCNGGYIYEHPARIPELMDGTYANILTPSSCTSVGDASFGGYFISEGFMKLGKYSCSMQSVLEEFINCSLPYSYTNPTVGNLVLTKLYGVHILGIYAQMALNASILGGTCPGPSNLPSKPYLNVATKTCNDITLQYFVDPASVQPNFYKLYYSGTTASNGIGLPQGNSPITLPIGQSSVTITGIYGRSDLSFYVVAENGLGASPPSEIIDNNSYEIIQESWASLLVESGNNMYNNKTGSVNVKDLLNIVAGYTATLKNIDLRFGKNGKLVIENGATLIVDNATIGGYNECGSQSKWQGIELEPNATIQFLNGGTISNAINGITQMPGANLQIDGGTFANNTNAILASGQHLQTSFIKNSNFINNGNGVNVYGAIANIPITNNTFNLSGSNVGVYTQNADVTINNNTFINNNTTVNARTGYGINVNETKTSCNGNIFQNLRRCLQSSNNSTGSITNNQFKQSFYGIYSVGFNYFYVNSGVTHAPLINNNTFTDNCRSVFMQNANYHVVENNTFSLEIQPTFNDTTYGVYIQGGYTNSIKNNTFTSTLNTNKNVGVVAWNAPSNVIRYNTFTNLYVGCVASGRNIDWQLPYGEAYTPMVYYTGLKILENTFVGDATDIYVAPGNQYTISSNKTSVAEYQFTNYGISPQGYCDGVTGNPAGNKFSNTIGVQNPCANNSIRFATNVAPCTGCGNFVPLAIDYYCMQTTSQTPQLACYSDDVISTLSCSVNNNPSPRLSPICYSCANEFRTYANAMSFRTKKLAQLTSLVDGGNTIELLDEINSSMSPNALKSDLLLASPYLSDKVLITLVNSANSLPPGMMRDVLIENSPLSNEMLLATIDKLNTYPNGIKIQINNAQTGISERKKLEDNISNEFGLRQEDFGEVMRYLLTDSLNYGIDSVIAVLRLEPFLNLKSQLAEAYIKKGDYTSAQAEINNLDVFGREPGAVKLLNVMLDLAQNNRTLHQMTVQQKQDVIDVASANNENASYSAQAILVYLENRDNHETVELPDNSSYKTQQVQSANRKKILLQTNPSTEGDYEFYCTPNPAVFTTDFYYNLRECNAKRASIEIYNTLGQKAISSSLTKDNPFITIETTQLNSGVYSCILQLDGVGMAKCKLIIAK